MFEHWQQFATGVADFSAKVGSRDHIIEVSGFPSDPFKSDLMAFIDALQKALQSAKRKISVGSAISVEVSVKNFCRHMELRRLRAPMHSAVAQVVRRATQNGLYAKQAFSFGEVCVRKAGPHEIPDLDQWTIAACLTLVPRSKLDLMGVAVTDYRAGEETDWIYLRVPDEVMDPYAKIRGKLKIESRQLRGCIDGVIVPLVNGLHGGSFSAEDEQLRAVVKEFTRRHHSTTAIAIVTMPEKQDGTAGIDGTYFELGQDALPLSFWNRMVVVDRERSVMREVEALA